MNESKTSKNTTLADFIWKNADDLWGDFKHTEFGKIILPFTLLRRLECVLEPTREEALETVASLSGENIDLGVVLRQITGYPFYNTSNYSLATLGATRTRQNLEDYISKFSDNARIIFEQFDFANTIARMDKQGVLYRICQNFADTDLHPDTVPERVMSNIYEHLIRRFGAEVNEAAEDFMTPRDVVHLAIELLLDPDDELFINNPGLIRTLYDPTCGTGGFLADGMEHIQSLRDRYSIAPVVVPHGQELEPETHAVCLAGMLLKTLESDPGRDLSQNIKLGSTLSNDQYANERFHYCISNPPFGKKWEKDQAAVVREHQEKKFEGRFGPKLPRVSDGSMLFLLHLVSKLEAPERGGGRAAIVLSGSPLFNGNAGQGESEIRRFLLENDYVEAIIALPTEIFFRTGIGTYIWILSNKKPAERQGKVQLIDATALYTPMRKSEGNKKRMISGDQTRQIVDAYSAFEETETSKIFHYEEFGYRRVKVLRPLRMNIVISEGGFAALDNEKAWNKLSDTQKEAWTSTLVAHVGREHEYEWLEPFVKAASKKNAALGKADKALIKAFVGAFGVRDPDAEPVRDGKGNIVPDDGLTDFENVPLGTHIEDYMESEVLPWADDAYVDQTYRDDDDNEIGIVGYEINFNRYFYQFSKTRSLPEVDIELKKLTSRISEKMVSILDSDNEKFSKHYSVTVGERDTWLGAVPADWSLEKIKYSFQEKIPEKNTDVPPGAISYGRVVKKSTEKLTDETQETYQRIAPGEFLINPINLNYDLVSLRTALSTIDVKVSPAYIVLKHDEQKISPKFAEYLLNVFDVKHMKTLGAGVRQTITFKDIGNVKWALPNIHEQAEIADFIEKETKNIDDLIDDLNNCLALLREHRFALIESAVTGKIDVRNVG